jgi:hypothetical protein
MQADKYPRIEAVEVLPGMVLRLDFGPAGVGEARLAGRFAALGDDPKVFATAVLGEHGASVEWPGVCEIGGDALWRVCREQAGEAMPAGEFAAWLERMGLSLAAAAKELGLTRRAVAYYKSGGRTIPKVVMLACRGLETKRAA